MAASLPAVFEKFGVGEPLIVFERDRAVRDVEAEVAERAIVVFPAVMGLFEKIVGKLLDGFPNRQTYPLDSRSVPERRGDFDRALWKRDGSAGSLRFDLVDLAGIAVAVETDSDGGDGGLRQRAEQRRLVVGDHLAGEAVSVARLFLPVFAIRDDRGRLDCIGHFSSPGERERARPAGCSL